LKVHLSTGGDRDCLELVPETVEEAAALVFAGRSEFIPADATYLDVTPELRPFIALRVYIGAPRPQGVSPETRDAIDSTTTWRFPRG
jgi:hypothetical protein